MAEFKRLWADPPLWEAMRDAAAKHRGYLHVLTGGQRLASSAEREEFFSELPKELDTMCEALGIPGAKHACMEAINFLHRWSKRNDRKPIEFVDRELIHTLERVLERIMSGEGTQVTRVGNFQRMTTPAFVFKKDDTPDLDTSKDISATLAMNALVETQPMTAQIEFLKWADLT